MLAGATPLTGQVTVKGRGSFQIDVDVCRFFGDERQVYVEIYYGIHENTLSYIQDSSGLHGQMRMGLLVRSDTAIVAQKEWMVPHTVRDSLNLDRNQIMTGLESLGLPEGKYVVMISARDVNDPERHDTISLQLPVTSFPKTVETVSDIELSTTIQPSSNKASLFYKNTLEVMPNPARLFGAGLPIMYYYAEIYNLNVNPASSSVVVRSSVLDGAGREVIVKDKPKPRIHNSSVEIGTINLTSLRGGTYYFRLALIDTAKAATLAFASKKFFIYKPGGMVDSSFMQLLSDVEGSEFAVMSPDDVEREMGYLTYLMTDRERGQASLLTDLKSKQKFLYEFWKGRSPDPSSTENAFKIEYRKRIGYADQHYTGGARKGWKSDRGRVYILYGPPDEIERFPNSSESNPYEIWHYNNLQGGVIFVFVDRNSMGDYILVHSTHRNELQDANWFQNYALKTR